MSCDEPEDELEDFLGQLAGLELEVKAPVVVDGDPSSTMDALEFMEGFVRPAFEPPHPLQEGTGMPEVLVRSLNAVTTAGWTYNPRSDRHSVIKCVGMLFDLVRASPRLAGQLHRREMVFGINSRVGDKDLDLVIGTPGVWTASKRPRTLSDIVRQNDIELNPGELGALCEGVIQKPLLAVEAKAIMTDHAGAMPRVSDELERFRSRIQDEALTIGLILVNAARRFVSPGRNGFDPHRQHKKVNNHRQPRTNKRVISMVSGLPRRNGVGGPGFDGLGMVFIHCQNDGTPVTLQQGLGPEDLSYSSMLRQVVRRYESD